MFACCIRCTACCQSSWPHSILWPWAWEWRWRRSASFSSNTGYATFLLIFLLKGTILGPLWHTWLMLLFLWFFLLWICYCCRAVAAHFWRKGTEGGLGLFYYHLKRWFFQCLNYIFPVCDSLVRIWFRGFLSFLPYYFLKVKLSSFFKDKNSVKKE